MPSSTSRRDIGAVGEVAALHPVAEIVQHLGDAAHADAADADEMERADRLSGSALMRRAPATPSAGVERRGRAPPAARPHRAGRMPRARCGRRGQRRAASASSSSSTVGQASAREVRLRDDPAAAGRGERAGVGGLVIVGGVRIGDQQRRPADGGQLGDGRGAGAADHQMGARQPLRHIGEKAARPRRRCRLSRKLATHRSRSSGRACWLTRSARAQSAAAAPPAPAGTTSAKIRAPWLPPRISSSIGCVGLAAAR